MASRALYAHMPARNCASPPNIAANGARGDVGVPHQPARFEATMNVAPAKPASPRMDGAAIGCRNTRVPNAWPFPAATILGSLSVLMRLLLSIVLRSISR
jgi:hypothetical protein